jgi:hypothetical protein
MKTSLALTWQEEQEQRRRRRRRAGRKGSWRC